MATLVGVQDSLPSGWRKEWSTQYHTDYYVNIYTGASSWKVPVEPVYGEVKPLHKEGFTIQQLEIQPSPVESIPPSIQQPSMQQLPKEGHFSQQVHVQTEAVPALCFPPPPGSSQGQTLPQQSQQNTMPQWFPPPPLDVSQGQMVPHQAQKDTTSQYYPPPPSFPSQGSGSSQLQISLPPPLPPPVRPETIVHPQAGDLAASETTTSPYLQTRPTPLSRPRPRSFIGQMEMMKMQISDQSHIYGAKAMETKLGSKVGKYIPTKAAKETDPLLNKEKKEAKKLWDDRTEEEKKASFKKWGKRAAIGAGVVAAVVIGAEVVEHAGTASNAASSFGSASNHLSSGTSAMTSAANAATTISNDAAMNAAAAAAMQAQALAAGSATMSAALM